MENKTNKEIKVAHIHVWDKNNKGDFAIVLAVQELIKEVSPRCEILDFPVETLKEYSLDNLNKINDCDLVIIGGGGIFYSYFLPFDKKMIESISVPIYLFGLGYIKEVDAPKWPETFIDSVVFLTKKAKAVGVRDLNTKRFLQENGIEGNQIDVVGDPAVLLNEKEPEIEILKKLKLSDDVKGESKVKIGINLNYSGWLGFGRWQEDILSAYQDLAKYFQDNYNADIYYLKHHPGEENIYQKTGIDNLIKVDLYPNEQKYVYSQMDMIVGMMLHVGVMSFGALTPEISVAYDIRNYGFAEFIKHRELVIDLEKLKEGKLLQTAKQVFEDKDDYKKDFKDIKEEIKIKEVSFLQNAFKNKAVL